MKLHLFEAIELVDRKDVLEMIILAHSIFLPINPKTKKPFSGVRIEVSKEFSEALIALDEVIYAAFTPSRPQLIEYGECKNFPKVDGSLGEKWRTLMGLDTKSGFFIKNVPEENFLTVKFDLKA